MLYYSYQINNVIRIAMAAKPHIILKPNKFSKGNDKFEKVGGYIEV
jgi:hypothetical protein